MDKLPQQQCGVLLHNFSTRHRKCPNFKSAKECFYGK